MADVPLWTEPEAAARMLRGRLDWALQDWAAIAAQLTDPVDDYPCYFGTQGQQRGHNWYTVVDSRYPAEFGVPVLAGTLLRFRELAHSGPKRQSLIVLVGPPDPRATLSDHHAMFWSLLDQLGTEDRFPWPDEVPADPADPKWQWCFGGEPWFLFAGSPAYKARRSRQLGNSLTVVLQTRRVFQGLSGSTAAGRAAKQRIRSGLRTYDDVPSHPFLGDPAFSSTYKWRQYALPDDQDTTSAACPLRHRKGIG